MSRLISAIRRRLGESGEAAISFAMVAPIVLVVSMGVLEMGRLMFDQARATEATRRGARIAAMSTSVADLTNLASGPFNCRSTGGTVTCTSTTVQADATFVQVFNEMRSMLPDLTEQNIEVSYRDSGIGATETGGAKPYVTVRLVNYQYAFLMLSAVPGLPDSIVFKNFETTQLLNGA